MEKEPNGSAAEPAQRRVVLLVHGILGQSIVYWNLLKRYLDSDRFLVRELKLPFLAYGDLRKAAQVLSDEVDAVIAGHPSLAADGRVDIVAHSAGGLVARQYIRFLGGSAKVRNLVTLGTPHHGTITALLFPMVEVGRQLQPGSSFLTSLNGTPEAWGDVAYTSIYSNTDGVVIPASSCRLSGGSNVALTFLTHWGYLWRPSVYDHIRRALLDGRDASVDGVS